MKMYVFKFFDKWHVEWKSPSNGFVVYQFDTFDTAILTADAIANR